MTFDLFEHVEIVRKKIQGIIVDVGEDKDGNLMYTVESDLPGDTDDPQAYPGEYPLYKCYPDEIRRI